MTTKLCSKCGTTKPRESFPPKPSTSDGLYPYCRDCANAHNTEWRQRQPLTTVTCPTCKAVRQARAVGRYKGLALASARCRACAAVEQRRRGGRTKRASNPQALCQQCETPLSIQQITQGNQFCSMVCSGIAHTGLTSGPWISKHGAGYQVKWRGGRGELRYRSFPDQSTARMFRRGLTELISPERTNDHAASAYALIRKALSTLDAGRFTTSQAGDATRLLYAAEDAVATLIRTS